MVNGCTLATAMDMTGMNPTLTWDFGHQSCIIVSVGATVTWNGSQGLHPLVGGVSPTVDPASPIAAAVANETSASVTFDAAGDFPYFCNVHTDMQGVVYVQ
jgi:plastocyanin